MNIEFDQALGNKIRSLRKNKRMTQAQLGMLSDKKLSKATIVNIEKGRQQVSAYQLTQFARILSASVTDLLPEDLEKMRAQSFESLSQATRNIIDKH